MNYNGVIRLNSNKYDGSGYLSDVQDGYGRLDRISNPDEDETNSLILIQPF